MLGLPSRVTRSGGVMHQPPRLPVTSPEVQKGGVKNGVESLLQKARKARNAQIIASHKGY